MRSWNRPLTSSMLFSVSGSPCRVNDPSPPATDPCGSRSTPRRQLCVAALNSSVALVHIVPVGLRRFRDHAEGVIDLHWSLEALRRSGHDGRTSQSCAGLMISPGRGVLSASRDNTRQGCEVPPAEVGQRLAPDAVDHPLHLVGKHGVGERVTHRCPGIADLTPKPVDLCLARLQRPVGAPELPAQLVAIGVGVATSTSRDCVEKPADGAPGEGVCERGVSSPASQGGRRGPMLTDA
jgi:hypothetical protein